MVTVTVTVTVAVTVTVTVTVTVMVLSTAIINKHVLRSLQGLGPGLGLWLELEG